MAECRPCGPGAAVVALAVLLSTQVPARGVASQQPPLPAGPTLADEGRRLFEGELPLRNGGPPCAACHAVASLPFPNGGTVGPDLSGVVERLGPEGTEATLQTLFFPTMLPLYQQRALEPAERQALKAFLSEATRGSVGADRDTASLAALALGGLLLLGAASWRVGRGRLRGVRSGLVEQARRGGSRP